VPPILSPTPYVEPSHEANRSKLPYRLVAQLWGRMAGMYGMNWIRNYGAEPDGIAGDTWASGLADLSGPQLGAGLEACKRVAETWPPTMQVFRARCLGIPEFADVLPMLRPGAPEVSPFVRLVWSYLDPWKLQRLTEAGEEAAKLRGYERAVHHVLNGGELPGPAMRVEHDATVERMLYDRLHFERFGMTVFDSGRETCPGHDGNNEEA
jgi:hypothetical protein